MCGLKGSGDLRVSAAGIAVGVEALLRLPDQVEALRQEVAQLREELGAIRQMLPPTTTTVRDAAARLAMSERSVRRHIASGLLRSVKIGQSVRVDLGGVTALLAADAGR